MNKSIRPNFKQNFATQYESETMSPTHILVLVRTMRACECNWKTPLCRKVISDHDNNSPYSVDPTLFLKNA